MMRAAYEKREIRRETAARWIADGIPLSEVCRKLIVSETTVRNACRERGVDVPGRKSASMMKTAVLIAEMVHGNKTLFALALEYDVEFAKVTKLYGRCRELKLPVKERKRGRPRCTA